MSIRLMTAVWEADLSKVEWAIPAHWAPATKTRPERFIPAEKGTLSANDKSVLLAMADHAADDGTSVYPSLALLTQKTELSERTCQACLRHLEGAAVIAVLKKSSQHSTTHYRLLPEAIRGARRAGLKDDPRGARVAPLENTPGVHVSHPIHQESKSKATHQESKSKATKEETESKSTTDHGSAAIRLQQISGYLFSKFQNHPSGREFLRGEGSRREIFRGVADWKLAWDRAHALGAAIDAADATDFFDHEGMPRCSPWEWIEELLLAEE